MAETFNGMAEALQEQHQQLERQAFTDSLTGIANRALFEDRARHALNRSLRTHERIAVLMIDLDDFKLVNDGLGHSSGDELIALAAGRIGDATRPSDTVARLGGDEFAVLLENVRGLDDALGAAERIRRLFDAPFDARRIGCRGQREHRHRHGDRLARRRGAPAARRPGHVPREVATARTAPPSSTPPWRTGRSTGSTC